VKPVELDQGAVGAPARVGERQLHPDVPGRERQVGILKRAVIDLGVEPEGGECAVAVLAL